MAKYKIEPSKILTIDLDSIIDIPMVVTLPTTEVLEMVRTFKDNTNLYLTRHKAMELIDSLVEKYSIDTIILEENKLFIDKIDRYPDPYILRNVLLGYGMKVLIEDKYYNTVKYILEFPHYEWRDKVLNKKTRYAIDLYKSHIMLRNYDENKLKEIDNGFFYKALCMSECTLHSSLMKRQYQTNNKKRGKVNEER